MDNSQYGMIQEQGDMGLGFNPLYGTDREIVKETCETKEESNTEK